MFFKSFLKSLILLLTFLDFQAAIAQEMFQENPIIIRQYKKDDYLGTEDSLAQLFGRNKIIPHDYALPILLALSHFPELKEVPITFIITPAYIPLTSKPVLTKMFSSKEKWAYVITISNKSTSYMENILFKNLTFNSQVGVIGHELAHTVFYLDKDWTDIASLGVNYIVPRFRGQFEKDTDRRAIRHGLGWQLYEYSSYVRSLPDMSANNEWVDQYYLNPESIMNYMKKVPGYSNTFSVLKKIEE